MSILKDLSTTSLVVEGREGENKNGNRCREGINFVDGSKIDEEMHDRLENRVCMK